MVDAGVWHYFASCMTSAGKIADILGRRKVLYTSVVVFVLASLGAGWQPILIFLL